MRVFAYSFGTVTQETEIPKPKLICNIFKGQEDAELINDLTSFGTVSRHSPLNKHTSSPQGAIFCPLIAEVACVKDKINGLVVVI